jgi:hypothetical protein
MIKYKGGNGSIKEEAVIILGASNEVEGVDAEYVWIENKFGEEIVQWELVDQELFDEGNRQYDILKIKFENGNVREFWFEITAFYGK